MELGEEPRALFVQTGQALKGHARRVFLATVAQLLGEGGQRHAVQESGWNRSTIRKGEHERSSRVEGADGFMARGAKPVEARLPNLHQDTRLSEGNTARAACAKLGVNRPLANRALVADLVKYEAGGPWERDNAMLRGGMALWNNGTGMRRRK